MGVFFISTIRPPNLSESVRRDMEKVRSIIREAIEEFKESTLDKNQAKRFEISLARNYITSARIIVDKPHASWLFQQGVNILKAV